MSQGQLPKRKRDKLTTSETGAPSSAAVPFGKGVDDLGGGQIERPHCPILPVLHLHDDPGTESVVPLFVESDALPRLIMVSAAGWFPAGLCGSVRVPSPAGPVDGIGENGEAGEDAGRIAVQIDPVALLHQVVNLAGRRL